MRWNLDNMTSSHPHTLTLGPIVQQWQSCLNSCQLWLDQRKKKHNNLLSVVLCRWYYVNVACREHIEIDHLVLLHTNISWSSGIWFFFIQQSCNIIIKYIDSYFGSYMAQQSEGTSFPLVWMAVTLLSFFQPERECLSQKCAGCLVLSRAKHDRSSTSMLHFLYINVRACVELPPCLSLRPLLPTQPCSQGVTRDVRYLSRNTCISTPCSLCWECGFSSNAC